MSQDGPDSTCSDLPSSVDSHGSQPEQPAEQPAEQHSAQQLDQLPTQQLDQLPEQQFDQLPKRQLERRPLRAAGAVLGIGTDIIECERIERMLDKHGDVFLARVYTAREIDYCSLRKTATQHYAGRWAAKEAVLKSIGTGWAHGIQWTDVEVVNEQGGKPNIVLAGKAKEISEQLGIREIMISISHCRSHAVAYATALGGA